MSLDRDQAPTLTVDCSNCSAPLMDVFVIPGEGKDQQFIINCPHCNDSSYKVTLSGRIYLSPTQYTNIIDYRQEEGYTRVITEKGEEYGK